MTHRRATAVVVALGLLLLLGACAGKRPRPEAPPVKSPAAPAAGINDPTHKPQSSRYHQDRDGGPAALNIDVDKIPEPVPKAEPRARYGNKSPYTVLGRSYEVLDSGNGYVERGIASWYGNKFHGYMTSSFEAYDMYAFSAAHKNLPLPSFARVTNLANGKSVVVRVNDRGPFHENRVIDLSYAAAVKIGVWPAGTGLVEVRAIDPAHPLAEPRLPAVVTAGSPGGRIFLQLGAYGDRANAERVAQTATQAGVGDVQIQTVDVGGRRVHRVRIGPLADVASVDALTPRIERLGLGVPRVAIDN